MNGELFQECFDGVQGGKYYLVRTIPQFKAVMEMARKQPILAVDTETSGLDWVKHHACGIVLGWGIENNYYLSINHKDPDGGLFNEKQLEFDKIKDELQELLADESITKFWWNGKYDLHILKNLDLTVAGVFHDGLIQSFLVDENEDHSLKYQSDTYIDPKASKWEKIIDEWRSAEAKRRRTVFAALVKEKVTQYKTDPDLVAEATKIAEGVCAELEFEDDKAYIRKLKAQTLVAHRRRAKEELKDSFYVNNKKEDISYDYIPLHLMTPYACADVHYTYLLVKKYLFEIAEDQSLKELYVNEMALLPVLYGIERGGAKVNRGYLQDLGPQLEQQALLLRQEVFDVVGYVFNLNSTNDLVKALQDAGCKLKKYSKKTQELIEAGEENVEIKYSADKFVLENLATTHPFAKKILDYRALVKLKNTYVDSILARLDGDDYIHGSFSQNVRTGRMASYRPNLQNQPRNDNRIRTAFIIPPGDYVFVFIDYSQVELRLTAHFSQDPELLSCYPFDGEGRDVHSLTCAEVLMDMSYEDFLRMQKDDTGHDEQSHLCICPMCTAKLKRGYAKNVNFGIIYGSGPGTLQRQVSTPQRPVPFDECQAYIDGYLNKYIGVKRWIDATQNFLYRYGYVQNAFGRYRRFPDIRQVPNKKKYRYFRQGCNFMIQGTAADLFKYALVRVNKVIKGTGVRLVNVVHDEIQFYWPRNELKLLEDVKHEMEDFNFSVPIVADIAYSMNDWGHKKELG